MTEFRKLLDEVRACTICAAHLPLGPRPVLHLDPRSRILIASQAPGLKVHQTGISFNDPSGDRLRGWLGLSREQFYDPRLVSLVPMGMCYPGTGTAGDLPPRPECASTWRARLLEQLKHLQLSLIIGGYAQAWHLPGVKGKSSVTQRTLDWRSTWPNVVPLPHPSPRNMRWLLRNPWFEEELLPALRERVAEIVAD